MTDQEKIAVLKRFADAINKSALTVNAGRGSKTVYENEIRATKAILRILLGAEPTPEQIEAARAG